MARHNMAHVQAGTIDQEPEVLRVPASNYFDDTRWQAEMAAVFKRMPLMLAMSCELPKAGDYKTMEVARVPLLLVRQEDGAVRALINSCSHRGAVIALEPHGNAKRFACPYHAWTYNTGGDLIGVLSEQDFGAVDKSCHGLTRLPVAERAGMIWASLDPKSVLDIDAFLCSYDDLLNHFGFVDWHLFSRRTIAGPNWKIAYDGYMDLYHLPVLHKNTFGPGMPNRALYDAYGPHQRVSSPNPGLLGLGNVPESEWQTEHLMGGVWTIFPHVSIASFDGGGPSVMVSQLFPGNSPQESITVQSYLMKNPPVDEAAVEAANKQFDLLEYVVREEDYATGLRQQGALMSGAKSHVMFGRNEGGGHRFHRWVDALIATADADLPALFARGAGGNV